MNIEATGGGKVPYLGYVEVTLQIPGVQAFNKDVLMFVLEENEYGHQVPIQIGTLHLDKITDLISKDEIYILTNT